MKSSINTAPPKQSGVPAVRCAIYTRKSSELAGNATRIAREGGVTVTQVVQWHLDRIDRYNGVYGAIEVVLRESALARAAA